MAGRKPEKDIFEARKALIELRKKVSPAEALDAEAGGPPCNGDEDR